MLLFSTLLEINDTMTSKWGEDEILARAEMLSDELITIWKYPKKD